MNNTEQGEELERLIHLAVWFFNQVEIIQELVLHDYL